MHKTFMMKVLICMFPHTYRLSEHSYGKLIVQLCLMGRRSVCQHTHL